MCRAGVCIGERGHGARIHSEAASWWLLFGQGWSSIPLLIERGAKVNLVNGHGGTPLDMIHKWYQNSAEMIAFLESKGAKRARELPQPST